MRFGNCSLFREIVAGIPSFCGVELAEAPDTPATQRQAEQTTQPLDIFAYSPAGTAQGKRTGGDIETKQCYFRYSIKNPPALSRRFFYKSVLILSHRSL